VSGGTVEPTWFELNLNTLELRQVDLDDWPRDMRSPKMRMHEEGLETAIAYNLRDLFPGEELLLVQTQKAISSDADIIAMDPLGISRVMELKAKPTSFDSGLWAQALSYGLRAVGETPTTWHLQLARALPRFPEDVSLSAEALRVRRRTPLGRQILKDAGATLPKPFAKLNYFETARLQMAALQRLRGVDSDPLALNAPTIKATMCRAFGLDLASLDLRDSQETVHQVLETWGGRRSRVGAELTIIAPNAGATAHIEQVQEIEERGLSFHLINAELRWDGQAPNPRVILRWEPVYRSTPTSHHQFAIKVRKRLQEINQAAADFEWYPVRKPNRRLHWGHQGEMLATTNSKANTITTSSEWLVDGLAHLKRTREQGIRDLSEQLQRHGVTPHGKELAALWGHGPVEPAAQLLSAYHDLITGPLRYDPVDRYRRLD
jgi:hypothetical protein